MRTVSDSLRSVAISYRFREELNVVFDHTRTKIPSSVNGDESSRLTKLDILTQTEEYIKRLEVRQHNSFIIL